MGSGDHRFADRDRRRIGIRVHSIWPRKDALEERCPVGKCLTGLVGDTDKGQLAPLFDRLDRCLDVGHRTPQEELCVFGSTSAKLASEERAEHRPTLFRDHGC